jgi:hypothetical protein
MATETTKTKKAQSVKLNLVNESAQFIPIVQKECAVRAYDVKKVIERLKCPRQQALTLIALAQIEDARASSKSAKA